MKKLTSIIVLIGIFLGSFFAQDADARSWDTSVTIHESGSHSGTQNIHKLFVFSEISKENEDSKERFATDVDLKFVHIFYFENRYIKNNLKTFISTVSTQQQTIHSSPLFLVVRSIRI